jgi:hypothetical protein
MLQLCWFLLWLISFNVFTIAFQDEDLSLSLHQVPPLPLLRLCPPARALVPLPVALDAGASTPAC